MSKKIGLVIMFRLDTGGGAPRLIVDLIKDLNMLGHKVFLLNPFKLNYKKMKEMYHNPINLEKVYDIGRFKRFFCKNSILGRKMIKKAFLKMAGEVDKIIDVDGGIIHNYLPENFDKSKYIIWRFAAVESKSSEMIKKKGGLKRKIKEFIKKILGLNQNGTQNSLSKDYRIYPIDEWTKRRLTERWGLPTEELLIHSIHTEEYKYRGEKKKNQIAVLARLAQNKMLEGTIEIFSLLPEKYKDYELIIFGGTTSDSGKYLKQLDNLIKKLGVSKRVKIIKNPSSDLCKKILIDSKVLIDNQRDISLTMGPVEAMAAGCIILAHNSGGTYLETLREGKFGFGFEDIKEGGEKLGMILNKLEKGILNNKKSIKRADFLSEKNFIKRLKEVLE